MSRMDASATTDETLLQRYSRGEMAAFEMLYERHELPLWRFVLRMCANRATAEELTQDIWLAVTREAVRFPVDTRFAPWLFTVARNRVIDRFRTAHRHLSFDEAWESGPESLADRIADDKTALPQERVLQMQQGEAILAALATLPPAQREAFVLQAESGMSIADIAATTGTTVETAKSRLRYARDKLRQLLREHA
jgi:RNA polymerase sigma factor (sigma-70 family)